MDYPKFIVQNQKEESISMQRVNNEVTTHRTLYYMWPDKMFGADLGPNCLTFWWYFEKMDFEKKNRQTTKYQKITQESKKLGQ